jgi:type II secretory pathway pseudopilin PulG
MRQRRRRGFTLTEFLVACALSVLVVGAVFFMFLAQRKAFWRQHQLNDVQQNVRAAADMLAGDLRMAGYGFHPREADLPLWVTWVSGISGFVNIADGAGTNGSDVIRLVGVMDDAATTLATGASAGATVLHVASGTGSMFDTSTRSLVHIGMLETLRVLGVSGDTLTVSAHPSMTGRGIKHSYPVGTPVELVQVVTYDCRNATTNFPYRPYMIRNVHHLSLANDLQMMAAVGIENLQAVQVDGSVRVTITGKMESPDPPYQHPVAGDHYRRKQTTVTVMPRSRSF